MLKNMCLYILVISCLLIDSYATIVPFTKSCKSGDNECLLSANIQIAIPYFADGIPEFGIPAADPMNLQNVTLDQGYFKLTFQDMKVVGSRMCKVVDVKRDIQESTLKMTLDCPFEATGRYTFSGKICFFDVNDEGDYRLKTDSIRTTIISKIEKINGNDGKKYWNLKDYEYFFEPSKHMHFELANLFAGDIGKAQPLLDTLNNDWRNIITEFGEPIVSPIVDKFYNIMKTFFLHVPINQLDYV